jgi:hypothetical protein
MDGRPSGGGNPTSLRLRLHAYRSPKGEERT